MKKLLLTLLFVGVVSSVSNAQTVDQTGNLIDNSNWTGVTYAPDPNDCCSNPGGSQPLYDTSSDIIKFSYGWSTVGQIIGINSALSGSGIQVNGYTFQYDAKTISQNGEDPLTSSSYLRDGSGNTLLSTYYEHGAHDWQTFSETKTLTDPYSISGGETVGIEFSGYDQGYWAGLYGPRVRNISLRLNYSVGEDPCEKDPLSSTSCSGYTQAYTDQQCGADPLYDSSCKGYEQAYYDQQCDYDPFYDTQCPGYDQALLLQDAAGTDFIFGDDISDFYEPIEEETDMFLYSENETNMFLYEEETDMFTEEPVYEEPVVAYVEETEFFEQETVMEEVYVDPVNTSPVEVEEVYEEVVEENVQIEEEITHVAEDMSNNEPELLMEEPLLAETTETERAAGPSINAVAIALNTVALAETNSLQTASAQSSSSVTQSSENSSSVTNLSQSSDMTFGSFDSAFGDATFDMMLDPTITVSDIQVSQTTEQVAQEEQTVDFQLESSAPQQDTGFAEQQNQSFSTGQSITAVLNNVQPNFSRFDVAPPSQQEQQTTAKAESQAGNMSEEQLAENLDEFANDMKDSGGFGDQSLTVFLMGRNGAFSQYNNVQLQDNPFYTDRGMAGGNVQNDRNSMLQLIGTDSKHEDLISLQYK